MDINEIYKFKNDTEQAINELLNDFTNKTGLKIADIRFKERIYLGKENTYLVNLGVYL